MKTTLQEPIEDIRELDQAADRLMPLVQQACDSEPSPAVLAAIHDAAERQTRQPRRIIFFRLEYAAAAVLAITLTCWLMVHHVGTQAKAYACQRQTLDDAMFLCGQENVPAATTTAKNQKSTSREELARRLLTLQGLDAEPVLMPETAAEQPEPSSKDSQSRNMHGLQGQTRG